MVRLQAEETHPLPFFMIITAKRADSGRLACSGTGAFGGVTKMSKKARQSGAICEFL